MVIIGSRYCSFDLFTNAGYRGIRDCKSGLSLSSDDEWCSFGFVILLLSAVGLT